MFEFTTLTVFNKIITATNAEVKAKTAAKGYNVVTSSGPKPEVRIGNTRFNKENVIDIQKKVHTPESLAKVEIDFNKLMTAVTGGEQDATAEGSYRIVIYVGLSMNSQDSFYANPFVYKGKPFFIEFPIKASDTATTAAARLVKIADKYLLFTAQEKILNVSANSGVVTFEGVNGYQQLKQVLVLRYNPEAKLIDCCTTDGDFQTILRGVPAIYELDENGVAVIGTVTGEGTENETTTYSTLDADGVRNLADDEIPISPGLEAFLDYDWMVHNLRLPTLANTNWWTANKSELPVVGGNYTQFIVRMCAKRLGVSGSVVGHETTSVTTHIFYVLDQDNNVTKLVNILEPLLTGNSNGTTIKTEADTDLSEPYANAQS